MDEYDNCNIIDDNGGNDENDDKNSDDDGSSFDDDNKINDNAGHKLRNISPPPPVLLPALQHGLLALHVQVRLATSGLFPDLKLEQRGRTAAAARRRREKPRRPAQA